MIKISPDQLQSTIQGILHEIPQKVDNVIDEASEKVAKEAVQELKATSPRGKGRKSGQYAKGWSTKKDGKTTVVYNRTDYMLTHLLENGHDVISHGKKVGHVGGRPHIKPAEEKVIQSMQEEVERGIEKL
jgi:hypothetical protein